MAAEDGEEELETEVGASGVAESLDEISVSASELPSALPQLLHVEAASRVWAPHFGQTIAPAGVANLDGAGTRSIFERCLIGHAPL
jgi:hypothetical protein